MTDARAIISFSVVAMTIVGISAVFSVFKFHEYAPKSAETPWALI
jgi:hypothetical protein